MFEGQPAGERSQRIDGQLPRRYHPNRFLTDDLSNGNDETPWIAYSRICGGGAEGHVRFGGVVNASNSQRVKSLITSIERQLYTIPLDGSR